MHKELILIGVIALCFGQSMLSLEQRPLTVEDAICTHRIADSPFASHKEVAISADGSRVAYIVMAPDVQKNTNNYELFVRSLTQTEKRENGRLLFQAEHLAQLQWVGNGDKIAVIRTEIKNHIQQDKLVLIDARSGNYEFIESPTSRFRSFSFDATGDRVIFSAALSSQADFGTEHLHNEYGFRVAPGEPIIDSSLTPNWFPGSCLYSVEFTTDRQQRLTLLRPRDSSGHQINAFDGEVTDLEMSPNGSFLLFRYDTTNLPSKWSKGFYSKHFITPGDSIRVWGLLSLNQNTFHIVFDAPAESYISPIWAADSHAFILSSLAPEGSPWLETDIAEGLRDPRLQFDSYLHLFAVDIESGAVSEILHKYTGRNGGGIAWAKRDGPVLVVTKGTTLTRVEYQSGTWKETAHVSLFPEPNITFEAIAQNGESAAGIQEDIEVPPDIVAQDLKNGRTHILTDLNPQYRHIALGSIERVKWRNKYGAGCWGYLIKPTKYVPGDKYPLVVMNAPVEHFFVADSSYTTAFPPQSLANDGFVVLMVQYGLSDITDLPTGFPGRLAEAYNFIALVESGANHLVRQGLVNKNKVGIIGFSRTSWKTDFLLTHSDFKFAAASSADSGIYNYGTYWVYNMRSSMTDAEEMLGGPPYGRTLKNWLKYAPAFNAERVQCPLLMEYVGHGHDLFGPTNAYEFFTALYRQSKPVELFFYPRGEHPLDTPSERLASLQRNVDWFRFWLQDKEGKPPIYDPNQYARWRELRRLEQSAGKSTHIAPISN